MTRDPSLYLDDILEAVSLVDEYTRGTTKEEFHDNRQLQDAVIRRLEIIGEAVKNLPQEIKDKHSGVPWKKIAGLRDVLVHEYFGVKIQRTWKVAKKDAPKLKKQVLKIKKELEKKNA